MKRKTLSLSTFSSCSSSCSENIKKQKIPHTINSMAPTIGGESWPPLLEEKMLDVFIAAQEKAEQNGLGSKHASYWDDAVSEVNGHIQDNFPYLLPKDVASVQRRLKQLRRINPTVKCTCAQVEIPNISSSALSVSGASGSSLKRKYGDISFPPSPSLEKEVDAMVNSLAFDNYITEEMANHAASLYSNLLRDGQRVVVQRFCVANCVDDKLKILQGHMHQYQDYM